MLDIDNSRSKFIFEASRLEEKIRPIVLGAHRDKRNLLGEEQEAVSIIILELQELNVKYFGASEDIRETLDKLENAAKANDSIESIWEVFMNLSERSGGNFGTWMI